jgi:hypothetical protein
MEILNRQFVGELGVQGRRYQGNVPYPGMKSSSSLTVLKRFFGNMGCFGRDSEPTSLIKVSSQSETPLKQSAV